eukprot:COSAG04_NODE_110_length_25928_cov_18.966782_25_plen_119_part_00
MARLHVPALQLLQGQREAHPSQIRPAPAEKPPDVQILGPAAPSDLQCPTADALAAFEKGVRAGDINWHAFPFNAEPEAYEASLFSASLNQTFVRSLRRPPALPKPLRMVCCVLLSDRG